MFVCGLRDASIAKILKTKSLDGFLGPALPNVTNGKNPDTYWGRMSLVLGLQSFVECEGPYAPAKSLQAAMEQALVRHHISFCRYFDQIMIESVCRKSLHGAIRAHLSPQVREALSWQL